LVQLPGLAVSVCPCSADPAIVGGELFAGGDGGGVEVHPDVWTVTLSHAEVPDVFRERTPSVYVVHAASCVKL
jgi:hypothetical protein